MIDIVIVGDKESQLTKDCIKSIKETTTDYNIIVVPFDGNYNRSLNVGIRKGKAEYVALCNNDLIFHKGWDIIAKRFISIGQYDSLSPYDILHHYPIMIPEDYKPIEGFEIAKSLCGWCIITTRELIEKIGYLDEKAKFWRSDYLYGKQLQKHGFTHAMIPACKVSHLGSQTLNTLPAHKQKELTIDEYRKFRR